MFKPNRVAVYLTALSGIAGAVAVPVAQLDTTSTAGVIAGVVAIVVTANTWLLGWQKHEARTAASADEPSAVDPILAGAPVSGPGTLQGDSGQPTAVAIDPKDAQIAALTAQLAQFTQPAGQAPAAV